MKVDDWSPRVLNATEFGNSCFQTSEFITFLGPQSEDCLFLNVFTPSELILVSVLFLRLQDEDLIYVSQTSSQLKNYQSYFIFMAAVSSRELAMSTLQILSLKKM